MRLWSISPELLDSKGLVACWRESLLALNVLQEKTKGYKNHPQLERFKKAENPLQAICNYLHRLCDEADRRGYNFKRTKIPLAYAKIKRMPVTSGQLDYEFDFLKAKVLKRTGEWKYGDYRLSTCNNLEFVEVQGTIEYWEKVK